MKLTEILTQDSPCQQWLIEQTENTANFHRHIINGKICFVLLRGITGKLAQEARRGQPITQARRKVNYWMTGYEDESIEDILHNYDQDMLDNYGSKGVLIKTSIIASVQHKYLIFPKNWGMAGDELDVEHIEQKVQFSNSLYIVSKGPIINYEIVKDYKV